ncbi:MAG: glycyl-radical enzyme activating protein [Candidatus Njordarchaeales archaeon]
MSKNQIKGLIFDIKRYAIHDGPGIRTTVFMKGCPLKCWWCHNPEGISSSKDLTYFEYKCIRCKTCVKVCPVNAIAFEGEKQVIDRVACVKCGICAESCPTGALKLVGYEVTVDELMEEIQKDILLYDYSEGGVTFSGGEPLFQPLFLKEALKECKKRDIHVALDTSGYASPEVFESIIEYVDLFLYDLKLLDDEEHQKYTGVSNKIIKKNLITLMEEGRGKDVILRFPIIPGITDTEKNLNELINFVSQLKKINEIDILPFHDVSEKYNRLGMEYKMKVHKAPSEKKLDYIKEKLEEIGLLVKIGG